MGEVAIFSVGAVLFSFTTWATIAFGMDKMQKALIDDLEESDVVTEIRDGKYTDLHLTRPAAPKD